MEHIVTSYLDEANAGDRIYRRCEEWAKISEPSEGVIRYFLTPEHKQAADILMGWMSESGLDARLDEAGNVVGRYHAETGGGPYLIFGSHLDSVTNGGKYDGPLGILTALDCVALLNRRGERLPIGIEIIAFGDEEGARFKTTLTGSRAIAGRFSDDMLTACDADGISMAQAFADFGLDVTKIAQAAHDPDDTAGYVELHIEQGPVLENENLPVGVVTAISGQTRAWIHVKSAPNHAGTVPMTLRNDALTSACEVALAVEEVACSHDNTVATVGTITAKPGLANVIPGEVTMSLDVRSPRDEVRECALAEIKSKSIEIAKRRGVVVEFEPVLELASCPCADELIQQIESAIRNVGVHPIRLPSGAGHDGMAMSLLTGIGMIFVRCKGGISHSPKESVTAADIDVGAKALLYFMQNFNATNPL